MAKYTVIEPVKLKSGRVEPGQLVDLSARQAKQLLAIGAIEPGFVQADADAEAQATAAAEAAAQAQAQAQAEAEAAAQVPAAVAPHAES